jgi:quercetin dioxygenase-like cupin family protein
MESKYVNYNDASWQELRPWAKRRAVHGETCTVAINSLGERKSSVHSHPHEQITYIASGTTDFVLGDRVITVGAGDILVIPPDMPHGGGSGACVMVDFFAPKREDFVECSFPNK